MNRLILAAPPCLLLALCHGARAQSGGIYDLSWNTCDGGGGASSGGIYILSGTIGQPDAGPAQAGGIYNCSGGFWPGSGAPVCYSNCDGSTSPPVLNVNDFICFLNRFAAGCA